jgi:hypothetical protein
MPARDALGVLFTTSGSPSCSRPEGVQPGHRGGWCWEFVQGLIDRQAADAVRAGLDWKLRAGP